MKAIANLSNLLSVLAADDTPIDGDLVRLLRAAKTPGPVAELLEHHVRNHPASPIAAPEATEITLASINVPWSKFLFLVARIQRALHFLEA